MCYSKSFLKVQWRQLEIYENTVVCLNWPERFNVDVKTRLAKASLMVLHVVVNSTKKCPRITTDKNCRQAIWFNGEGKKGERNFCKERLNIDGAARKNFSGLKICSTRMKSALMVTDNGGRKAFTWNKVPERREVYMQCSRFVLSNEISHILVTFH